MNKFLLAYIIFVEIWFLDIGYGLIKTFMDKKRRTKMKFRICWLECHNPMNWVDWKVCEKFDKEKEKYTGLSLEESIRVKACEKLSELNEKIEQNGIKNIIEGLPTKSWQFDGNDGWIEVECEDTFEATNIEEAKKIASEYDCGSSRVFSVFDENDEIVFTEEDLVEV